MTSMVFTALAFALFAKENVDVAVIEAGLGGARDATNVLSSNDLAVSIITTIGEEHLDALGGSLESIATAKSGIIKCGRPLVIGGPFDLHIEQILRNQASSMCSPVVSACDPGVHGIVKSFGLVDGKPCQFCDICIQVKTDLELFIELSNIKLRMLGHHQLQNAITATCASLCLRNQGWEISNKSIHGGLENTELPGRSQFLTLKEVEALGLSGVSVLVDGAHTEASARALADTIKIAAADQQLALVVAMASDKDHVKFARQLLSGLRPKIVLLTEVSIAGGNSRMTTAFSLKDAWVNAAAELDIDFLDIGSFKQIIEQANPDSLNESVKDKTTLFIGCEIGPVEDSMKAVHQLLKAGRKEPSGLIVVTGTLHLVSCVLASIDQ